jgi:hypothetical protein
LSLHSGFVPVGRRGRVEFGNAQGAQDACWVLAAAGDAALGLAVSECEVNHLYRTQRLQRLGGREVQFGSLEFLLERAVEQEGQRCDEDVSLHALIGAVIDRA